MTNELTNNCIHAERERERESYQTNGRRKLLFNFFRNNRKRGGRYLISDTSTEVLDYE